MPEQIKSFRELNAYQLMFQVQQEIFQTSKAFPAEEKYSLTDQIRRSSRSVGANITEAWAKRRYPANFLSKLTDADGELQETMHWLATALACGYISEKLHQQLEFRLHEVGGKLGKLISMPEKFIPRDNRH